MAEEKIIDRILALLAKAQSTTHEAEADAFFAGAQKLMMKYAVDEAMLKAAGKGTKEEIVTKQVEIRRWIGNEQRYLVHALARIFNCRTYWTDYGPRPPSTVVGYESDVQFVVLMFESIRAQAWTAALHQGIKSREKVPCDECEGTGEITWSGRPDGGPAEMWKCDACKGKGWRQRSTDVQARSFLEGYYYRVVSRCRDRYEQMEAEVGQTTALALRDKGLDVDAWLADNVSLGKPRKARDRQKDHAAFAAGAEAGQKADISGGRGHVTTETHKELT